MPIEIKELHIKVKIEAEKDTFSQQSNISTSQLEGLKSQIVKDCVNKVLEKIKENEER